MSESRRAKGERSQFGERGEDKTKRERSHLVPMDSGIFPPGLSSLRLEGKGRERNREESGKARSKRERLHINLIQAGRARRDR